MDTVNLNELAQEIHAAAVEKGFWDVEDAMTKHIVKMVSELGEVVQEDRCGRPLLYVDDIEALDRITSPAQFDGIKPEGVAAELADLVMMLMDMCIQLEAYFPDEDIDSWLDCNDKDAEIADMLTHVFVATLTATLVDMTSKDDNGGALEIIYAVYIWLRARGFDLWQIIRLKMEYNKSRPKLHGRLY